MDRDRLINTIKLTKLFFDKSTSKLEEADSAFAPKPGMYTAAQQVAHVAHTIDWFMDGAFSESGMDMDFVKHNKKILACTSMTEARAWHEKSNNELLKRLAELPEAEWEAPIKGPVMGGFPRSSIVSGLEEHTSHHRGALAVYQRLLDKVPEMPYA
ncbi:MAG: DinB family protein [Planctomycetes bacterium]|nr:DinB family protein [Planctomycetota bacterium]